SPDRPVADAGPDHPVPVAVIHARGDGAVAPADLPDPEHDRQVRNASMKRNALVMAAGLALLVAGVAPAGAQTMSAEVRTWAGHTYQLTEPSLEVLYTIVVPKKEDGAGAAEGAPTTGARAPMLFGSPPGRRRPPHSASD